MIKFLDVLITFIGTVLLLTHDGALCWCVAPGFVVGRKHAHVTAPHEVLHIIVHVSVPDPGSGAILTPWIRDGKKSRSEFGMNIADNISVSLETIFGIKNT